MTMLSAARTAADRGKAAVRPRLGFTLIELLVVIAIIALLIAILLPSLEQARMQSKRVACTSHIKGIATSARVYESDDPNGWGIPVHPKQYDQCPGHIEGENCTTPLYVGAYEWGGKSGIGRESYFTGSPGDPLNSKYGSKAGFGPASRPMNALLYPGGFKEVRTSGRFDRSQGTRDTQLDLGLFRCPGDDGAPRGAHCPDWVAHGDRSSYDHFGNSYAANVFMVVTVNGRLTPQFDISEMGSNSPYMRPTSRIVTPARTVYFEENIGRWAWSCRSELDADHDPTDGGGCKWIGEGVDPGPTKTLRGWHGVDWTYNRSFVDGHAEFHKLYLEGTEDANGFAHHYRSEIVFANDIDRSQRMRCITVRGNGWQKDTLPQAFVRTQLIHSGGGRPSYEDCVDTDPLETE